MIVFQCTLFLSQYVAFLPSHYFSGFQPFFICIVLPYHYYCMLPLILRISIAFLYSSFFVQVTHQLYHTAFSFACIFSFFLHHFISNSAVYFVKFPFCKYLQRKLRERVIRHFLTWYLSNCE